MSVLARAEALDADRVTNKNSILSAESCHPARSNAAPKIVPKSTYGLLPVFTAARKTTSTYLN